MNNPEHDSDSVEEEKDEELEEILLPPPHYGKTRYDPKPPSQYWLEIEKRYEEQQEKRNKFSTEMQTEKKSGGRNRNTKKC